MHLNEEKSLYKTRLTSCKAAQPQPTCAGMYSHVLSTGKYMTVHEAVCVTEYIMYPFWRSYGFDCFTISFKSLK